MICNPLRIEGARNIEIGNQVFIQEMAWLAVSEIVKKKPVLKIEDDVYIGDFSHIYAVDEIEIKKGALIANHVYIADNTHEYEDVSMSIKAQPIRSLGPVIIGEGCWLGEKVSVLGASVGAHSIVGANSVVTKDIPDFCIAVGSPAKVIKRYDFETEKWERSVEE